MRRLEMRGRSENNATKRPDPMAGDRGKGCANMTLGGGRRHEEKKVFPRRQRRRRMLEVKSTAKKRKHCPFWVDIFSIFIFTLDLASY